MGWLVGWLVEEVVGFDNVRTPFRLPFTCNTGEGGDCYTYVPVRMVALPRVPLLSKGLSPVSSVFRTSKGFRPPVSVEHDGTGNIEAPKFCPVIKVPTYLGRYDIDKGKRLVRHSASGWTVDV